MKKNLADGLTHELRRGNVIMAVLAGLQSEKYGYQLLKFLATRGLKLEDAVLYPLLRRLEGQGCLHGAWRMDGDERPKRYYQLSPRGRETLEEMLRTAKQISAAVDAIYEEDGDADD